MKMGLIYKLWNKVYEELKTEKERRSLLQIFKKYKSNTMVPVSRYLDNLALCQTVKNLPGDIYECGVWRGGMIAGIATVLAGNRRAYLFDSFEGLPPATELDGVAAKEYQELKTDPHYFDNCKAEVSFAQKVMEKTGMDFTIVKGWFEDSLSGSIVENPIAVLRLDGDWYDSTMVCLENLLPYVAKGGLVIIDDYYNWDGCTLAVHDYLSKHKLPLRIQSTKNGVCFFYK